MIEIAGAKERLDVLLLERNAIAHSNGRIEAIRPAKLQKIRQWQEEHGVVLIGTHHLSFPIGFVKEMAHNVKVVLEDLIRPVKEKY